MRYTVLITLLGVIGCDSSKSPKSDQDNGTIRATDQKESSMPLPQEVMSQVLWSFKGDPITDLAAFNDKVRKYHIEIRGKDNWNPESIAIPCARIRIVYMCWHGEEQIEPIIELASDNGTSFTAGELLFKVHNAVVKQLRDIDHHFFEGLRLHSNQAAGKPPLYVLNQGS